MRNKNFRRYTLFPWLMAVISAAFMTACSTTSGVPEGEYLYIGIDKVTYDNYEDNDHASYTQSEVSAALDCEPNGALFGSSYHRTPFPYALWIYNAFYKSDTPFAKWMINTFGKEPVLMNTVNPEMRSSVAKSTLKTHGYLRGEVSHEIIQRKNPKKQKVSYHVDMGHLFTVDTLEYLNFPPLAQQLIDSTRSERLVYPGVPFDVETLDGERARITKLFRNRGYYYYQSGYSSYLADTLAVPGKVQLKLQMADSIPQEATHKWYIGKRNIYLKRNFMEQTDNVIRRGRSSTSIYFNGKKPKLRPNVLLRDLTIRHGREFCYEDYEESVNKITGNNIFSMVDFKFTPRDSTAACDTLDLDVTCIFDKPYDFYVETNLAGKTTGFLGPQLVLGLTKRNAFHGGETLNFNIHGNYEWQIGKTENNSGKVDSYTYGGDVSLEFPRLLMPNFIFPARRNGSGPRRPRFYTTPSTLIKASSDIISRSGYYTRHIVSGEFTYTFQTSETIRHRFSPLVLEYNYLRKSSDKFMDIMVENPFLLVSMADLFIPKMRYTFSYSSPRKYRNPIFWETTVSESGNLLSLGYMAFGKKWNEKGKEMFNNPYAQFFKVETDFTKTWRLSENSQLLGHFSAGIILNYGNSAGNPYTEKFYAGGANSVRAFSLRSFGPGRFDMDELGKWEFLFRLGDMKLLGNLELRSRLFGNLYGALFLDAGNVWSVDSSEEADEGTTFKLKNLPEQLAVGTGVGLRYDLDFFVIRLDWGIGIHLPYDTGKSGFYNIPKFRDGQALHLAIGYPF